MPRRAEIQPRPLLADPVHESQLVSQLINRVPATGSVSFVQREASGELWIKQIEISSTAIVPLVKAADGSTDRESS